MPNSLITNFISAFEQLAIYIENLTYSFYKECLISGLKEKIQPQVRMQQSTTWFVAYERALKAETVIN